MRVMTRAAQGIAVAVMAMALGACDSVGDGNKPESLSIVKVGFPQNPTRVYTCTRETLALLGTFTKGEIGEFSARAKWRSSNPAVIKVSNGDIPVPGQAGFFFASGQLIPVKPGSATISAEAFGLSTSLDITVGDPSEISISATGYDDVANAKTAVNIARTTQQSLAVTAVLDGYPQDITSSAAWDFVTADDTVATFVKDSSGNNTNVVKASTDKDGTLTARAKFLTCGTAPTIQVSVKQPNDALVLHREIRADTNKKFVVGTSELFRVYADFNGDGLAEQDLSTQVLVNSVLDNGSTTSALALLLPGAFGIASAVRALSTGEGTPAPTTSAPVKLTFCIPVVPPNPLPTGYVASCATPKVEIAGLTTAVDQLSSFKVFTADKDGVPLTGDDANVTLAALGTVQFRAKGTFASGFEQDVTRNITWSSNDTAVAVINATSGIAASSKLAAGTAKITGTNSTATPKTKEVTLTITNP